MGERGSRGKDFSLEKQLINGLRTGEAWAHQTFFETHYKNIFSLCLRVLRNHEDAEEAALSACFFVFSRICQFEERSSLSSWIYRITKNTALMKLRKNKMHYRLLNKIIHLQPARKSWQDACPVTSKERQETLVSAFDQLPKRYKEIFLHRVIGGFSNQETANAMGVSVPSVKSRWFRVKEHLRLDAYGS